MKRVICVVEDEKDLNNLVAQPVLTFRMMMCICGFWISCWMINPVLI